jgi:hypothetical protein
MLRRLAARWNSDEITNRSWGSAVAGAIGAPNRNPLVIRSEAGTSAIPFSGNAVTDVTSDAVDGRQAQRQRALGRSRRQAMLGCPAVDIL